MTDTVRPGDMVVTTRGRMGVLWRMRPGNTRDAAVVYDASGTHRSYRSRSLRRATVAEIKAAELWGVGCAAASDQGDGT
jgi:hypothetical protein